MKELAKSLARLASTVAVAPLFAIYVACALVVGKPRAFPGFSQLASLWPGTSGVYLRGALYRLILPRCGLDACVQFGTVFSHPTAEIGAGVYVGVGCMVGDVTLEDDVLVGSHVSIINGRGQHGLERLDIPLREQPGEFPRVTIGADSWIGDRAVVTANVGRHCVVGAAAVVTKAVPDYAIVVGNPARVVGDRREQATDLADPADALESLRA